MSLFGFGSVSRRWSALLLVPMVLITVGWFLLRLSLPGHGSQLTIAGLDAAVEIRFDRWQRPFVSAISLADAVTAQGWLHGRDRLWQMELLRRAGQGRIAELLGADLIGADQQLWRAGVPQLARRLEQNAGAEMLALVDRYLLGVNHAIADYRVLPPEFLLLMAPRPHWQRRDVFALGALMAYQSAGNMDNELLRLALVNALDPQLSAAFLKPDGDRADYPYVLAGAASPPAAAISRPLLAVEPSAALAALDRSAQAQPGADSLIPRLGFGSNGWVVAAERSASGAPLFAFDSHDELGLPNLFYEVHLFYGNGRQLRGWSAPGLPGVINGFNEHIAWGFTNIGDTQDLFLETRSPDDPLLFKLGEQWVRATTEQVSIAVRGGEAVALEVITTHNGPLLSDEPPLSLAWTVNRLEQPRIDSIIAFNQARNWAEFSAAMDAFPAPTLNATYADNHGTIGFRSAGKLPRRGAGQGLLPLDGSVPGNRWRGLVEAAAMPTSSNPEAGYLAAANARVQPAGAATLVSADNAAPYRIARIQQVLGSAAEHDLASMQALQLDWIDGQARLLLPALLAGVSAAELDPLALQVHGLLLAWQDNPVASRDSAAALVWQQWYLALARQVFAEPLGEALFQRLLRQSYLLNNVLDTLILEDVSSPWWQGQRAAWVTASLQAAATQLGEQLAAHPANWRLDQRQHVLLEHELGKAVPMLGPLFNQPPRPWGGGTASVGRASYSYQRPFQVRSGATVRVVAEMTAVPTVAAVIPGGQSGHPSSAHYVDQYPAWLAGDLLPLASHPDAVPGPVVTLQPAAD